MDAYSATLHGLIFPVILALIASVKVPMAKLSPQNAADRAGVSRRTVMVAIEKLDLKASRDNRNHWKIQEDDLAQWISDRDTRGSTPTDTSTDTATDTSTMVARLEEQLKASEERLMYEREASEARLGDLRERLAQRERDYQDALEIIRTRDEGRGAVARLMEWLGQKR